MKIFLAAALAFAAAFLAAACDESPADINTPRNTTGPDGYDGRLPARYVEFEFDRSGDVRNFVASNFSAKLDTSGGVNAFWLDMTLLSTYPDSVSSEIMISEFKLKVDSVPTDGSPVSIDGASDASDFALYRLLRGTNVASDTSIVSDSDNNRSQIILNFVKTRDELAVEAEFLTEIDDYVITKAEKDSLVETEVTIHLIDSIPGKTSDGRDTIFIKERDSIYYVQEMKTFEYLQSDPASTSLNGSWKFFFSPKK